MQLGSPYVRRSTIKINHQLLAVSLSFLVFFFLLQTFTTSLNKINSILYYVILITALIYPLEKMYQIAIQKYHAQKYGVIHDLESSKSETRIHLYSPYRILLSFFQSIVQFIQGKLRLFCQLYEPSILASFRRNIYDCCCAIYQVIPGLLIRRYKKYRQKKQQQEQKEQKLTEKLQVCKYLLTNTKSYYDQAKQKQLAANNRRYLNSLYCNQSFTNNGDNQQNSSKIKEQQEQFPFEFNQIFRQRIDIFSLKKDFISSKTTLNKKSTQIKSLNLNRLDFPLAINPVLPIKNMRQFEQSLNIIQQQISQTFIDITKIKIDKRILTLSNFLWEKFKLCLSKNPQKQHEIDIIELGRLVLIYKVSGQVPSIFYKTKFTTNQQQFDENIQKLELMLLRIPNTNCRDIKFRLITYLMSVSERESSLNIRVKDQGGDCIQIQQGQYKCLLRQEMHQNGYFSNQSMKTEQWCQFFVYEYDKISYRGKQKQVKSKCIQYLILLMLFEYTSNDNQIKNRIVRLCLKDKKL